MVSHYQHHGVKICDVGKLGDKDFSGDKRAIYMASHNQFDEDLRHQKA
jgi:hypothetical protein